MATANISLQSICAGGDHITLRLTVGAATFDFAYLTDILLSAITNDDKQQAASVMAKFHCLGMTRAEAKAALMAGITVTTTSP